MNILRHQDQTGASSLDEEGRERERSVDVYLVIHCSDDTLEKVLLDKEICSAASTMAKSKTMPLSPCVAKGGLRSSSSSSSSAWKVQAKTSFLKDVLSEVEGQSQKERNVCFEGKIIYVDHDSPKIPSPWPRDGSPKMIMSKLWIFLDFSHINPRRSPAVSPSSLCTITHP
jgi:hypothetical protein